MLITRRPAKCIFRGNPLKKALLIASLATALAAAGGPALAADGTWTQNGAGTWSNQNNWQGTIIPGSTTATNSTDTAWFSALLTAARTVTVDANRNIQNITFDGSNSGTFGYTLSGGPFLLTSGGTVSATGNAGAHTDTISAPMTILGNNATYTFANNSTLGTRLLTISGAITGQSTTGGTTTVVLGGNATGTNTFSSSLSAGTGGGAIAVVKEGSGTWRFSGGQRTNETTSFTINGGTLLVPSANQTYNWLGAVPTITFANVAGAQLDFGTGLLNAFIGFGSLSGGGANGGNIVNAGYANSGIYIGYDNTSTTYGGRFISGTNQNGAGIFKVGTGRLTLTGSGNDAGGATRLRGGELRLDFSQATTGSNILASTRAMTFEGGRLLLTGSSGASSNSQTFASTTVAQGNSGIALTSNGATGLLASLGAITRNAGGTLDVTLPGGTQSTTNGVRTTSTTVTNGVTTSSTTAYLTVGGTTWGVTSGTNVAGLSSYAIGTANYTSTNNVDVTNGDTISTGTVNTLRFNGSNTLNLTGTTTIGAGGVLVTPAATAGAAFSGGTLQPGGGNELVLINNGSLLTVNSVIANNSSAARLTLSGTGNFRLNGNNTYTGVTTISSGTVTLGSATALGASGSSAVWIGDNPNAVLDLNGYNISIGSLAGAGGSPSAVRNAFGTPGGRVLMGANSLTAGANNTSTTYGGRISGSGTFTKVGTGNLTITGSSALAGFSGSLVVENGALTVGNVADTQSGTEPLGTATIYLGKIGGGSDNATLTVTGSTGRPIVLATGNSGTMTIDQATFSFSQSTTMVSGGITGAGELLISRDETGATFTVSGLINHTGNLTLRNTANASGFNISGGIGSNVVNVTLNNNQTSGAVSITSTVASTGTITNIGTLNSSISGNITSASRLVQNGAGRLTVSGSNTFTAPISIQTGTLQAGNAQAFGINSPVTLTDAAGATLSVNGVNLAIGSLSGGGATGGNVSFVDASSILTTGGDNTSTTFSGGASGAGGFTKVGTGAFTLSGSNSYSGATTVSAGMLQFGRVNSLYGGTTANWTATNIRTGSGATLAFNVGGTDEFTTGNVTTLLTNLASSTSATNGMNVGSILGFDTTNASGGTFTIADVIANSTGGSGGTRGLRKLGSNTLLLSASNSFTGATSVEAGTLAIDRVTALNSSSGIGINAGTILDYTGTTAGTLSRNVTVATSGTGTIRNSGGQKLTLSGVLTKDGRVLRLTGGTFDVTGQIVGASDNSDLLVDGTSTVTLLSANTYNGPTFVNQSSTLILGTNSAIPNNSIVTLGDGTTRGTLDLGGFTDSIGGLVFSGSGGTVRMAANQTASPQLSSTSALVLGSNASLDLAGMQTSAGNYRLISSTGLSGTFGSVSGLNSNYVLRYGTVNADEISAQRKAEFGTITATPVSATIITGGSTAFGYTVANATPTGGSTLSFTSSNGSNVAGSSSGSAGANATSSSISGLVFTGTSVGLGQTGSFTLTDPNAIGSPVNGTVTVSVLNHSLASFAATDTVSKTLNFGTFDGTSIKQHLFCKSRFSEAGHLASMFR